ncbi:hypothetical protein [Mycobacterium uberis]|uniref:hypothetical protein n=1 Tax=Mycobacterium uberis TaxID=2162698 RepID=UPI001403403C|nr:hypothetical protein [Mycobacterium uberis]
MSTAAILFAGCNTSCNGFLALASFVAEDRFLPRSLMKRGHRLVFINCILMLTVLSLALLVVTGGAVNALVLFYAIGVFTELVYGRLRNGKTPFGPPRNGFTVQAGG